VLAVILTVTAVVTLHARDAAAQERVEALGLPSLSGEVVAFYSEGYADRATYLQDLAVTAATFLQQEEALGLELNLTLAVLDAADWARLTKLPYGISHILSDSPTAVLPASKENRLAAQYSAMKGSLPEEALARFAEIGVEFDDAAPMMVDLIGFHEIGHIYSREYGVWPTEKWLSEFTATYLAYAVMTEKKPQLAKVWDMMCEALAGQPGIEHTSLADFERLYIGVGGANYGWYQARFQQKVKRVYGEMGMSFMHRLRESMEKNPESLAGDPFRLGELDAITTGFSRWAGGANGDLGLRDDTMGNRIR